ncbi:MAG: tRNA (guanosine(37)-N1)-methyltransferase TrmD [Chromatiales bacterium]|nr:tRNA (guanosine(37)-N1)-methyltransferase TrmD [Chromatiales bacterium]
MRVAVVSVFPQMLDAVAEYGVTGRALERGLLDLHRVDPRAYATDRHRTVDDRPYGGGPGMVMTVEPCRTAVRRARELVGDDAHTVLLSPQGRRLDPASLAALAGRRALVLLCGRYEGLDERLVEAEIDEEISIGDYVLSGGELAAMVVIDALARLLPGALGHQDSAREDSFADGLLDCPHYSRPEVVDGVAVPAVLMSGDHAAIRRWRLQQSLGRTWLRRPDLLAGMQLDDAQVALLQQFVAEHGRARRAGRPREIGSE